MKIVRSIFLFFMLSLQASVSFGDVPSVLGFQAWKTSRIDDARGTLEKTPKPALDAPKKAIPGVKAPRVDQKLQQAQLNFDIAQELTVNDYFVLYLTQFKQREAFVEVAKKLSPEEIADLMLSYQKHLAGSSDIDFMTPSASGLSGPTAGPVAITK
jgi:hypothetical protein